MASTRVTLYRDDDYGVLLRSIENLVDGGSITVENGPLFRVVVRDTITGATLFCEPSPISQVPWSLPSDPQSFTGGELGYGAADGLGTRKAVIAIFSFGPLPDGNYLSVVLAASLIDSQPEHVRFSTFCWWSGNSTWAVLWQSPILMQLTPLPRNRYEIGVNGGLATQEPTQDLAGDGDEYQFSAASRFEPELNVDPTDRMEAAYPGPVGVDLSAYGSRSLQNSVYIHGTLDGTPTRIRDFYDQTSILLDHQVLTKDASVANNNGQVSGTAPPTTSEAHRYVRVFKATGDVFGEDVGFDWRAWVLSSKEGSAILPTRARDRSEMARYAGFPACLLFGQEDAERQTTYTDSIADEYRELIPSPASDNLFRYCRAALDPRYQDAASKRPAQVNDVLPSLYDLQSDAAKKDHTTHLRSAHSMFTVSSISPRRPAPYDGGNYWDNYDGAGGKMSTLRVKDSLEQSLGGAYKTTDQWLQVVSIVASAEFDGTYTYIRTVAAFDHSHWNKDTVYDLAGHASHDKHLGFVFWSHSAVNYLYPIELGSQGQFNLNKIAVAGDVTANIAPIDTIVLYFTTGHFIPGADRQGLGEIEKVATTSLCSRTDDWGAGVPSPANGFLMLMAAQAITEFCHYLGNDSGAGLLYDSAMENPVCWADTHGHPTSSSGQFQGWRTALPQMRSSLQAAVGGQWMQFDDAGPIDYLVGTMDGSSVTHRRMTLTTSAGKWGMSPLFLAAFGDFVRTGFFENDGEGHVSGAGGAAAYAGYEAPGESSFIREAILSDWMLGRKLLSIGHEADAGGILGTRPNGLSAFSPLNHETYGKANVTSIASMLARLLQVQILFGNANFHGQWMRSLERIGSDLADSSRGLDGYLGHDIGSHESGDQRPFLMHCVFAMPSSRRKLVAVIANPSESASGDSFRFLPRNYAKLIPGRAGTYRVTRYEFTPTGYTTKDLGYFRTSCEVSEKLDPAAVVAYTFEFVSGMQFIHRYDDDPFESIDVAHALTHTRIEPITGQGSRFQYGFTDYHPEDDVKIASMDLRVFLLGRSENR